MRRSMLGVVVAVLVMAAGCSSGSSSGTLAPGVRDHSSAPRTTADRYSTGYLLAALDEGVDNPSATSVAEWNHRLDALQLRCGGPRDDVGDVILYMHRQVTDGSSYRALADAWIGAIGSAAHPQDCNAAAAAVVTGRQ